MALALSADFPSVRRRRASGRLEKRDRFPCLLPAKIGRSRKKLLGALSFLRDGEESLSARRNKGGGLSAVCPHKKERRDNAQLFGAVFSSAARQPASRMAALAAGGLGNQGNHGKNKHFGRGIVGRRPQKTDDCLAFLLAGSHGNRRGKCQRTARFAAVFQLDALSQTRFVHGAVADWINPDPRSRKEISRDWPALAVPCLCAGRRQDHEPNMAALRERIQQQKLDKPFLRLADLSEAHIGNRIGCGTANSLGILSVRREVPNAKRERNIDFSARFVAFVHLARQQRGWAAALAGFGRFGAFFPRQRNDGAALFAFVGGLAVKPIFRRERTFAVFFVESLAAGSGWRRKAQRGFVWLGSLGANGDSKVAEGVGLEPLPPRPKRMSVLVF